MSSSKSSPSRSARPWDRLGSLLTSKSQGLVPGRPLSSSLVLDRPLEPHDAGTWVGLYSGPPASAAAPQQVAVRFGAADWPMQEAEFQAFELQARASAHLAAPELLQVYEYGRLEDGTPYLAQQFAGGQSLATKLHDSGPLSLVHARQLLGQAVDGLSRVHAAGLVHGHINPSTVFLEFATDQAVRASLSPVAPPLEGSSVSAAAPQPQAYHSPEQLLQARAPEPGDDLWALGVTLYEALTTIQPFEAPTEAGVAVAICNGQFDPPSRYRADLPLGVDLWFARALAKDPLERFRTARELVHGLAHALDGSAEHAGLAPLDEGVDDEQTAQWELPEEWLHSPSGGLESLAPQPPAKRGEPSPEPTSSEPRLAEQVLGDSLDAAVVSPIGTGLPSEAGSPAGAVASGSAVPPRPAGPAKSVWLGALGLGLLLALAARQLDEPTAVQQTSPLTAPSPPLPRDAHGPGPRAAEYEDLPIIDTSELFAPAPEPSPSEAAERRAPSPPPQATNSAVPQATNSAVPQATNSAVPQATRAAVPQATNSAVPQATNSAVPQATNSAVPQATRAAAGGGPPPRAAIPNAPRAAAALSSVEKAAPNAPPRSHEAEADCSPPFRVDESGIKRIKPHCL